MFWHMSARAGPIRMPCLGKFDRMTEFSGSVLAAWRYSASSKAWMLNGRRIFNMNDGLPIRLRAVWIRRSCARWNVCWQAARATFD